MKLMEKDMAAKRMELHPGLGMMEAQPDQLFRIRLNIIKFGIDPKQQQQQQHQQPINMKAIIGFLFLLTLVFTTALVDDSLGQWGPIFDMSVIPIHAALLRDGQVLVYGTDRRGRQGSKANYEVWDARTGEHHLGKNHKLLEHNTSVNIFCSTMSMDASTSNVLIIGGDDDFNYGVKDVVEYDSTTMTLQKHPAGAMHHARWYASSVVLPDGRIFVIGGKSGQSIPQSSSPIPEVWQPGSGFRELKNASVPEMALYSGRAWYYPLTFVNSHGAIIVIQSVGMNNNVYRIGLEGDGSLHVVGTKPFSSWKLHPSLLYDVDKVVMMASNGALWEADISDSNNVTFERKGKTLVRVNGVFSPLPDGRVLITGGDAQQKQNGINLETAVNSVQIWDPADPKKVYTGPDQDIARLYHSTALILPDGSAFVGGGGAPGPLDNLNGQVYFPGYLFDPQSGGPSTRPTIDDWPRDLQAGKSFSLTVDNAETVKFVTATKSGSVTHASNYDARWVKLSFEKINDKTIRIFNVPNRNVLIPGVWLLTTIDINGVPSESRLVGVNMGHPRIQMATAGGCVQPRSMGRRVFLDSCDENLAWRMEPMGNFVMLHSGLDDTLCLQARGVPRVKIAPCNSSNSLQRFELVGDYTSTTIHVRGDHSKSLQYRGTSAEVDKDPIVMVAQSDNKEPWVINIM